jgi:class 3 adenylate cyclase
MNAGKPLWLPGTENPDHILPPGAECTTDAAELVRAFAFVDLCGFVAYCDNVGAATARPVLAEFREIVRAISAKRGVRVAKWIGDGALLVGLSAAPVAASAVEIVTSADHETLRARAGLSIGRVLNMDGDDYIGRAINLSSRLCDLARPGEVLSDSDSCHGLPDWICRRTVPYLEIKGIGERTDLSALTVCDGIEVHRVSLDRSRENR